LHASLFIKTDNDSYVRHTQLSGRAVEKVKASRKIVDDIVKDGKGRLIHGQYPALLFKLTIRRTHAVVYGINTGFGALGDNVIKPDQLE